YVRVQLGNRNALHLAEVQVFGLAGSGNTVDEMDSLSLAQRDDNTWRRVRFGDEFLTTPIVVAGPASNNDMDPISLRIRETASYGFDIKIDEWDHQDGSHSEESTAFMALRAGNHNLGGVTAQASQELVDHNWKRVNFNQSFSSAPVLLTQVASEVASASVVAQVRNISTTGFDVRLRESAADDGVHSKEAVNFIALSTGTGSYQGKTFRVGKTSVGAAWTAVDLGHSFNLPAVLASLQSTTDQRAAAVRYRNLNGNSVEYMVQNETSNGGTQNHATESVGWLAFEQDDSFIASVNPSAPSASGQSVGFSATPSPSAGVTYTWNYGDGSSPVTSSSPNTSHTYAAPGRYVVTLTLTSANGATTSTSFTQSIHAPLVSGEAKASSTIIAFNGNAWNVNPDNDSVSVSTMMGLEDEISVGASPWSLTVRGDKQRVWVSNKDEASVSVINTTTRSVIATYALPTASQPHGILFARDNNSVWIALEATGQVVQLNANSGQLLKTIDVGPRPRHLSLDASGNTLLVSRYITPALPGEDSANPVLSQGGNFNGGEVVALNTSTGAIRRTYVLRHSNRGASESTGPGLPNYLGAAVFAPDGDSAWVPSKQDNITAGTLRGNGVLTFDQTVRAISSRIDLNTHSEDFQSRVDHDNASVASHAIFDATGMHLFTALEGNRQIAVSDP
ncbi:MAG: PKD domain-containing protein, partial [Granulosicoccaceae bacterium]